MKISFDDLCAYFSFCNEKTKLIVLNSPSNPTGVVYDEEQLLEFSRFALNKGLWVLFDESYREIVGLGEYSNIRWMCFQICGIALLQWDPSLRVQQSRVGGLVKHMETKS